MLYMIVCHGFSYFISLQSSTAINFNLKSCYIFFSRRASIIPLEFLKRALQYTCNKLQVKIYCFLFIHKADYDLLIEFFVLLILTALSVSFVMGKTMF